MVAFHEDQSYSEDYLPKDGTLQSVTKKQGSTKLLAVIDSAGDVIAYVPEAMGQEDAESHAVLFAEAPRLLDLVRFAAEHLNENSHPGLMKAFQSYCNEVLDRVEDSVVIS